MAKELTIATKLSDISLPGVISGCRMMFSSENRLSISKGRFVTPTGGFAEIRHTVRDAILLPDNQDIVYITGSVLGSGAAFNTRTKKNIGREETVLAMVKVLRYPVKSREDIKISHAIKSSNSAMSEVITLTACSDNETRDWIIPWKVSSDYRIEVYIGGEPQQEPDDFRVVPVKDNFDKRYTKIVFNRALRSGSSITVNVRLIN